ncbi:TetR family transcriptional regulator C-terminal domain-containing protein [Pleomorphomonas koreensis]|uniref:TetR family transcriptional regulator C-terminal domain-containing protein n=1 Tax=Pleomorphomonas koreensis TaxID=257440 RepID=UPI0003FD82D0|nr:TetR family transcriptional regulator C-terminal domain-containing protein [Pleomorphomonas koreensis]
MTYDTVPDSNDLARARGSKKRTRIQVENEERILDAALEVFSRYGFRGATVDQIAERAGMSKPNLLYYFRRKHDIYTAVLTRTLDMWLAPFRDMAEEGDPETELSGYIRQKLEQSRDFPLESRLFIGEVLQGAPHLDGVLKTDLKSLVAEKAEVIRRWIKAGRLIDVDPVHLIFMIWATTQHYADFDVQVRSVLGCGIDDPATFRAASDTVIGVLMRGILPGNR